MYRGPLPLRYSMHPAVHLDPRNSHTLDTFGRNGAALMRSIDLSDAQNQLVELVEDIANSGEAIQIESEGEQLAVIVNPREYASLRESRRIVRERAAEAIEQIQKRNEHLTEAEREEIEQLITETVEEVRQEMYEERKRKATSRLD